MMDGGYVFTEHLECRSKVSAEGMGLAGLFVAMLPLTTSRQDYLNVVRWNCVWQLNVEVHEFMMPQKQQSFACGLVSVLM